MTSRKLTPVFLLLFAACASAQRSGDRAAAIGNWDEAVLDYTQAVHDDPDSNDLRKKLGDARKKAAAAATALARQCSDQADWECALSATDHALTYLPDDGDLLALRKTAVENALFQHQAAARDAAAHHLYPRAFSEMSRALALCAGDQETAAALRKLQAGFVADAVAEARKELENKAYPEAIALLQAAAGVDPLAQPLLDQARADQDRELLGRAEERARQGDAAALRADWQTAQEQYRAALAVHAGGRAERLVRMAAGAASAQAAATRQDFGAALQELSRALAATSEESFLALLRPLRGAWVDGAVTQALSLRAARQYPQAIALLETVVRADASRAPVLAETRRAYDQAQASLAEALAQQGDAALASRDWRTAEQRYAASVEAHSGGRAARLRTYSSAMGSAESARQERRFGEAAAGYRAAVETGADSSGYAAHQLQEVQPRRWLISIRAVKVRPVHADGTALVGPALAPAMGSALRAIPLAPAGAAPRATLASHAAAELSRVPPANQPRVRVELTLPDGRRMATPERTGAYATWSSAVVLSANAADDRALRFRVTHDGGQDLGAPSILLAELLQRRDVLLSGESVLALEITADPDPALPEGAIIDLGAPGPVIIAPSPHWR